MISQLKTKIVCHPSLKKMVLFLIAHPYHARPRWWVRTFVNPFVRKKKHGACIRWSARLDILPFNAFELGRYSVVEDFATVNNGVGPVYLGDRSRIGLGCTVIGPVRIGNDVQLAQNVVLSGLNHNYQNIEKTINEQGVSTQAIDIEDDVWIGANSVVLAGCHIGRHVVVAAGSVVTCDIPPYSVCAGAPARVVKQYNLETRQWEKTKK